MLADSAADDCRGVSEQGSCLGTKTAVRCTRANESAKRRVTVTRCSELGLVCQPAAGVENSRYVLVIDKAADAVVLPVDDAAPERDKRPAKIRKSRRKEGASQ